MPIDFVQSRTAQSGKWSSCRPQVILAEQSAAKLLNELLPTLTMSPQVVVGTIKPQPIVADRLRSQSSDATDLGRINERAVLPKRSVRCRSHPVYIRFYRHPEGCRYYSRQCLPLRELGLGYFGITADDRISGHPPLHFDLSTFDIYGSFSAGEGCAWCPRS